MFIEAICNLVCIEEMKKEPKMDTKNGLHESFETEKQNMLCIVKLLGIEKAIDMLADSKTFYETLKSFCPNILSQNFYSSRFDEEMCDLYGIPYNNEDNSNQDNSNEENSSEKTHFLVKSSYRTFLNYKSPEKYFYSFKYVRKILEKQIDDENNLDKLIENYKFVYKYAPKNDKKEMDELNKIRDKLVCKIQCKYPEFQDSEIEDSKEIIIQAFLDSPELKTLKDLESLEIRQYISSATEEKSCVILDFKKHFCKFIKIDKITNDDHSYQVPKCLIPVVNFCINKGILIPILDDFCLRKIVIDNRVYKLVPNPKPKKRTTDEELTK